MNPLWVRPPTMSVPLYFKGTLHRRIIHVCVCRVSEHKHKLTNRRKIKAFVGRKYLRERPRQKRVTGWHSTQASQWNSFLKILVSMSQSRSFESALLVIRPKIYFESFPGDSYVQ